MEERKQQGYCPLGLAGVDVGKFMQKIDDIHEDVIDIKKDVKAQNSRVRTLENWRYYILGVVAAVGAVIWLIR